MVNHGDMRTGFEDEQWEDTGGHELIVVVMTGADSVAYQGWLRLMGQQLKGVPSDGVMTVPYYVVVPRKVNSLLVPESLIPDDGGCH